VGKKTCDFFLKAGGCMPLFFTFLFLFNTIHYLTHHIPCISYDEAGVIWEEPVVYTVLFTPHTVAVMRLGQAGFMR